MNRNELLLDSRNHGDLCRRVEELASSYTPEWQFDQTDPDVGSTLALIYTGQMADNIRRINQLPEKYHTEFVNMLGLTLKPAYPASGVAVVELMQGAVPGVALPRGSRLMAEREQGMPTLFETMGDVYITNARLTDILSLSGTKGRICPLMGGPRSAELPGQRTGEREVEESASQLTEQKMSPFALFDYEDPGIEKNAMLIYHRTMLGGDGSIPVRVSVRTPEGRSLAEEFSNGDRWRWSYVGKEGMRPFRSVYPENGDIVLFRDEDSVPVMLDGAQYHVLCLEALCSVEGAVTAGEICLASARAASAPELILSDGEALEAEECMPFGDTVSLFDECYICDDQVFSQQDAEVTISFDLSCRKKFLQLTAQQMTDELRIIKRKPRAVQYDTVTAAPERIALEYFNGQGWRRLPCSNEWSAIMDGSHGGTYHISFRCPEDWARVPINGYEGRCMRLRVTQADNCYLLPCEHTMPVLRNVTIGYEYRKPWKQPQRLRAVCGTQTTDLTKSLLEGKPVTLFRPLPYPPASLYLGFDRPMEGAPVSMLFDVEEHVHFRMEPVVFEYSTRSGFKQMKVIDGTDDFSGTGTVLFMPPSDFAATEVEGVERWWLRLRGGDNAVQGYHARVRSIRLNAVDIRNQQTQPEEELYVETSVPNMTFPLACENILSADVFVSEMGQLSRYQMKRMLEEQPQNVRVEYDFMGEISAFFVRWTEVDTFDNSRSSDRHYMIDRVANALVFGDGIHVRIPQAQQGVAIIVRAVSCDGKKGNLPAGAVNSFYGNMMYVESVSNPAATYAGSDLEDLDSARRRGAELLSGRGRLISELDYVRAVKAFSATVRKVKCHAGVDLDGRPDPSRITVAVMTQDYSEGAYAFNNIRVPLRRELLERCEATVTEDCLVVAEPVYVEISVSVWVKAESAARAFDIQNLILDSIRGFIDPMERPGHGGWEIGVLPSEAQLKMLLQSLSFQGRMERMIASARYVDRDGAHEAALGELPELPFGIAISGEHRVYIEFE